MKHTTRKYSKKTIWIIAIILIITIFANQYIAKHRAPQQLNLFGQSTNSK